MSDDKVAERLRELEKECAVMTTHIEQLEKDLGKLSGGVNRGLWIIGGGFIAAIVSWVTKGGLTNGI